ncbi:f-boxkelch-repeat protein, partial [Nicotiana attenuata]
LPVELITEILLKLTSKDPVRFKCVSKSWLQLISSPYFVKTHMKLAANDKAFSSHRVIFEHFKSKFKVCCLPSLFQKGTRAQVFDIDSPVKKTPRWIVGSANGLICFLIDFKEAFIWNPTIRKSKKLRKLDVQMRPGTSYYRHGFGYDELHDDYKVVIICGTSDDGSSFGTVVNIYSLRTDSWTRVYNFPGYYMRDYLGKCVNGKIYWASTADVDALNVCNLITLDLTYETWGKLELPNYGEANSRLMLGGVGSDLALVCICPEGTTSDVWMMKDYGVNASWTKMFTIKYPQYIGEYMFTSSIFSFSTHFCQPNNGEILLLLPPTIMIYNPKDGSTRKLEVAGLRGCQHAEICVETLVDPNELSHIGEI